MNISFEWFLTIPGMLITGGVILLIIALIMLLVSSSRGKKNTQAHEVPAAVSNSEVAASSDLGASMGSPVMGMNGMGSSIEMPSVQDQAPIQQPTIDPVAPSSVDPAPVPTSTFGPMSSGMNTVSPVESSVAGIATPAVAPVVPTVGVVAPVEVSPMENVAPIPAVPNTMIGGVNPAPVVEVSVSPVEPTPAVTVEVTPSVGEIGPKVDTVTPTPDVIPTESIPTPVIPDIPPQTPMVSNSVVSEGPRPIYGGANPLEATQNLPKIDVHHEPYSGGREVSMPNNPEVAPVIPTPAPVVDPVVSAPVSAPEPIIPDSVLMNHPTEVVQSPIPSVGPVQPQVPVSGDVEEL